MKNIKTNLVLVILDKINNKTLVTILTAKWSIYIDIITVIWYNIITVKNERGDKVKSKKKPAEILKEIDRNLDRVLSILTKLALVAMSIKTIIEIIAK